MNCALQPSLLHCRVIEHWLWRYPERQPTDWWSCSWVVRHQGSMFCLFGTCCLWVKVLLHQNICFAHEVLISISWHVALRDNNLLLNNCLKMCHLSSHHYPSTSSMTSVNCSHQSAQCIPPISEHKTLELHIAEFCHDVLQIPMDVDHWLTANLNVARMFIFWQTISNLEMLMTTL